MGSAVLKTNPQARRMSSLTNGDHLTWEQFATRWDATPGLKKAELINGIVFMSPLTYQSSRMEDNLRHWAREYERATPGTKGGGNATWRMLDDAPQPDAFLRILETHGGSTRLEGDYLHGAPELVAEACLSSAAYDLNEKLELYREAGVKEYITVLIDENEVRWHRLERKQYKRVKTPRDGIFKSLQFPGLWLNGRALLMDDIDGVLSTLETGLKSPEHAAFVEKLKARKS